MLLQLLFFESFGLSVEKYLVAKCNFIDMNPFTVAF